MSPRHLKPQPKSISIDILDFLRTYCVRTCVSEIRRGAPCPGAGADGPWLSHPNHTQIIPQFSFLNLPREIPQFSVEIQQFKEQTPSFRVEISLQSVTHFHNDRENHIVPVARSKSDFLCSYLCSDCEMHNKWPQHFDVSTANVKLM
jgi:hypothetical protein